MLISRKDHTPDNDNSATLRNIAVLFFASADKHHNLPAVGVAGTDAYLTYDQLADRVCQAAAFIGPCKPGERIGLLSENRPEWPKLYLAILTAGAIVVPFDSLLKEDELERIVGDARISRLFVSPRFYQRAIEVMRRLKLDIEIIDLETIPETTAGPEVYHFNSDPYSPAVLIFTSGTTGKAKKVILTHDNIISNFEGIRPRLLFGPADKFLSVLPLHHTFEATCGFIIPLLSGCAIYYVRELNSREIINGIKKHQITIFVSVPLLFEKLYHGLLNGIKKAPPLQRILFRTLFSAARQTYKTTGKNIGPGLFASFRKKAGLASIRLMVSGGAPLPVDISQAFDLLGLTLVQGYGLSETSPVISVNPIVGNKHGTVGPVLDNIEVKIHKPLETGIGEICVRGPMVTPGYEDNPEETAKIIRDGWFHTGDLGKLDDAGYLTVMGREKNLIVSAAGKNIYPEEIESELLQSDYILEAMVYGKKADNREEVAAIIYPDYDALATRFAVEPSGVTEAQVKTALDPEIKAICARLADFKRIKHITYVTEELEKTSTKKIKRFKYQS